MGIVQEVAVAAGQALGIKAGAEKLASHLVTQGLPATLEVRSVAFEPGVPLPISCTIDGVGAPPPLSFAGVPTDAKSIVVLCEDPDAPKLDPFVHWIVYGIPATAGDVDAQSQHDYRLGENSTSEVGYTPAAPPPGHGVHHYHFQVFAVDTLLELAEGADRDDVIDAIKGHVLAWGELVGTYERGE